MKESQYLCVPKTLNTRLSSVISCVTYKDTSTIKNQQMMTKFTDTELEKYIWLSANITFLTRMKTRL